MGIRNAGRTFKVSRKWMEIETSQKCTNLYRNVYVQPQGRTGLKDQRQRAQAHEGWQEEEFVPDRWEELIPKKKETKVRKPPAFRKWFGLETYSDRSDDTDGSEWTEIERKKRGEQRRIQQRK